MIYILLNSTWLFQVYNFGNTQSVCRGQSAPIWQSERSNLKQTNIVLDGCMLYYANIKYTDK